MYFWKIKELKKDLIEAPLSEKESFKYLIANTILYSIAMVPFLQTNIWDIVNFVVAGIITVIGITYVYRCNNGSKGDSFLSRLISMGWVVGIRWLVLVIVPAVFVYAIALVLTGVTPDDTIPLDVIVFSLLSAGYWWLLSKHIKDLANKKLS